MAFPGRSFRYFAHRSGWTQVVLALLGASCLFLVLASLLWLAEGTTLLATGTTLQVLAADALRLTLPVSVPLGLWLLGLRLASDGDRAALDSIPGGLLALAAGSLLPAVLLILALAVLETRSLPALRRAAWQESRAKLAEPAVWSRQLPRLAARSGGVAISTLQVRDGTASNLRCIGPRPRNRYFAMRAQRLSVRSTGDDVQLRFQRGTVWEGQLGAAPSKELRFEDLLVEWPGLLRPELPLSPVLYLSSSQTRSLSELILARAARAQKDEKSRARLRQSILSELLGRELRWIAVLLSSVVAFSLMLAPRLVGPRRAGLSVLSILALSCGLEPLLQSTGALSSLSAVQVAAVGILASALWIALSSVRR